jgi:amino acid transporter
MLLYNLSSNAIAFALQALTACGSYDPASGEVPPRGEVIGVAIGALSLVIVSHSMSRKGGIIINNVFAGIKVAVLVVIIILGAAKAGGRLGGVGDVPRNNFTRDVFAPHRSDLGSWSNSIMLCLFSLDGFEQPFYVITEVRSPRRYFPKYTVIAVSIAAVLFMAVNVSYLLVIDKNEIIPDAMNVNSWYLSPDLATLFFDHLFEGDQERAAKAMAAMVAISIFGNLWVMTYTAARVKQELAKEGILPWSLFFATSYRTPYGFCQEWFSKETLPPRLIDRAPTAAYALHWLTSVFLIAVTAPISDPRKAYSVLVYLFTYSIILVMGGWVSVGLLMVKVRKARWNWQKQRRYRPWLSPVHVIFYLLATSFLAITAFVPPSRDSLFYYPVAGVPWFVLPLIGISAPAWGLIWFLLFRVYEWKTYTELDIVRMVHYVPDPKQPNEYIQHSELISHNWPLKSEGKMANDFAEDSVAANEDADGRDEVIELEDRRDWRPRQDHRGDPVEAGRRLSDSFSS